MPKSEITSILKEIEQLLELKGENPFKARAYSNAARKITSEAINIEKHVQEGTLGTIDGFGQALQEKLTDFVQNGKMAYYEKLKAEVPAGLREIGKMPGIGPKKARDLYHKHEIMSLEELEDYCKNGKLSQIKGYTAKSEEFILAAINHRNASRGKYLQQQALEYADKLIEKLNNSDIFERVEASGELRILPETITRLDFITIPSGNFSNETLIELIAESEVSVINDKEISYRIDFGIPVFINVSDENSFVESQFLNSSRNNFLEVFFKETGIDSNGLAGFKTEKDIFEKAGMDYIPPELREDGYYIKKAINKTMPELIVESDLIGMVHNHSTWSDGANSIREMVLGAKELGFEYFALCDHSQSAAYANGLTPDRIKDQHEEIDGLNEKEIGIRIIKGIESDILPDGSLDYPEEILAGFELVVASVHSSFRMSKKDMTRRIVCALKSPYTSILGHPTGRLLLARPPYEVDIKDVIDAAADYGKVIEINANPYRLDLNWENARYAKEKGVKISINPDAHVVAGMKDVKFGINVARKAGLTKYDVVNCMQAEEFLKEVNKSRI